MTGEEIKKEDLLTLIHRFVNDPYLQMIKERDKTMSAMEIYGVNRLENSHSDFLAWLFDSSADHKLGAVPADKFMKMLAIKCADSLPNAATGDGAEHNNLSYDELLAFLTNSNEVLESRTHREVSGKEGRIDIIFELTTRTEPNKIRVVFENKIAAAETGGDQTERYYNEFSKKEDYKNIYVFNSCKRTMPKSEAFVCTTYQDIVDYVIDPLLIYPDISARTKFVLKDYILALEKSASVDKEIDKMVMAIGKDTKKLLTDFWENNSELISLMAESLAVLYPENENYSKIAQATNDARRDYSKYSVNGAGSYGKGRMVEAVVNKYVELNPGTTVQKLKEVFPERLQGSNFIKDSSEKITDMKRYYESALPGGAKFYISNQWGVQTDGFVAYVNENIDGITVTKV